MQLDLAPSRVVTLSLTGVNGSVAIAAGSAALSLLLAAFLRGPAGTTDHLALENIGTNSHEQIDTALTRLADTSGTNTGDQDLSPYALSAWAAAGDAATLASAQDYTDALSASLAALYRAKAAAGADTQVLFNDGGVEGGNAGLTFNKASGQVALLGNISIAAGKGVAYGGGDTSLGFRAGNSNMANIGTLAVPYASVYNGAAPLRMTLKSDLVFGWSATADTSNVPDVGLWRDAAGILAQRNGTNPQAFSIYNTYTDASNYERLSVGWASNILSLFIERAGTGAARSLRVGTNGATCLTFGAAGTIAFTGWVDFAADGKAKFGTLGNLTGSALTLGVGAAALTAPAPALNLSQAWNNAAVTFTGLKFDVTDTASAAASLLADLQVGGVSKFQVMKGGDVGWVKSLSINGAPGLISTVNINQYGVVIGGTGNFSWRASNVAGASQDLFIVRDAANTLAQRNGTNAQTFRLYNTYTDASNFERGFIRWNGNVFEIGNEPSGTGVQRQNRLIGNTYVGGNLTFSGSGDHYLGGASTGINLRYTWWNGATDQPWLTLLDGGNVGVGVVTPAQRLHVDGNAKVTGFHEVSEMTAPAAPAANGVRLYAEDDGAGKTRVMALFATGAAVQIAIQP